MLWFGKSKKDEDMPLEILPMTPKSGRDDVTVQVAYPMQPCVVDTALATHIGTREYQQDAAYVCEPVYQPDSLAFGILCDGMGGMAAGERVSSDVVAFMANQIAALQGQDIPPYLEKAAVAANEMVCQSNLENGQESGTTLVAVVIRQGELFWLNVGDSRIYILRDWEMARITRDHNFALELQELVQQGRITQQQADEDPRKDALVSYIGAEVLEIIDVNRGSFHLQTGDIVLLCSDGLTKAMPDEVILELVCQHKEDLQQAARVLPLEAFDRCPGGMDNTSVILMQYYGPASADPLTP